MRSGSRGVRWIIGGTLLWSSLASASETITYTYDAKGRLVKVQRSGTVNNGVTTDYEHDKANNRKRVKVAGVGGGTSSPPVANPDAVTIQTCEFRFIDVVANDTDADGHLPLTLQSATGASIGSTIVYNATSIVYESWGYVGQETITYTIKDSSGATAQGVLTVNIDYGSTSCL